MSSSCVNNAGTFECFSIPNSNDIIIWSSLFYLLLPVIIGLNDVRYMIPFCFKSDIKNKKNTCNKSVCVDYHPFNPNIFQTGIFSLFWAVITISYVILSYNCDICNDKIICIITRVILYNLYAIMLLPSLLRLYMVANNNNKKLKRKFGWLKTLLTSKKHHFFMAEVSIVFASVSGNNINIL